MTDPKTLIQFTVKPPGSFSFILALHVILLLSYVILMPAFEGADEPDHLRYIEAVSQGEKIHPVDQTNPRKHGIEVYQPPLYYHLAALITRFFPAVFPRHLTINPEKNPNPPFLVHDDPGEIFPFDPLRRTLRFFRTLSVLLGIAALVIFSRILRLAMPENPQAANTILLVAALWPNSLQIFSVVSNDGLVNVLSLALILVVLQSMKGDRPAWIHGFSVGIIVGLGLLTKMTMLLVIASLFPAILFDLLLDKTRAKFYFKILPFVLLAVFLLVGPFMVFQTIWYGNPTGGALHDILVPSVVREVPLSFAAVISAMIEILPGRFLADLCWQHLTLPSISLPLFLLWFFLNLIMGIRMVFEKFTEHCHKKMLHMVLVLSSFVFMFLGIYRISTNWANMQFRFVWSLWPITLLAAYFAIRGLKFLQHVNTERVLSIISSAILVLLLPVNLLILHSFVLMYKPSEGVSGPGLDYFTFSDYYAQSPHKAAAYLDTSGLTDVTACRYFAKRQEWENVLFHARRAIQRGVNDGEPRLMYTRALRALGKPGEALDVLSKGTHSSYDARLLQIELLLDLGRFDDARQQIHQLFPEAPPDVQSRLQTLLNSITTGPSAGGKVSYR